MAIIKEFQTKFGIIANYHRLLKIEINSQEEEIEMVVGIYISAESREEGKSPLWHEYVKIPFNKLNFDPRDLFYPLLQQYELSYIKDGESLVSNNQVPHPTVLEIIPAVLQDEQIVGENSI